MRVRQLFGRTYLDVSEDVRAIFTLALRQVDGLVAQVAGDPAELRSIAATMTASGRRGAESAQVLRRLPRDLAASRHWTGEACAAFQRRADRGAELTDRATASLIRQAAALDRAAAALATAAGEIRVIRQSLVRTGAGYQQRASRWLTPEEGNQLIARAGEAAGAATASARAAADGLAAVLGEVTVDLGAVRAVAD